MKIILSPLGVYHTSYVSIDGLIITVDDVDYDLSIIPEGGQAEAAEGSPFIGVVTRDEVTINYCYDSTKAEPVQSTDWADYTFEIESGEVPCPIRWLPESELEVITGSKVMSYYQSILPYTGGNDVPEKH